MSGTTPRALGEVGLIARLTEGLATRPEVALGVGDDAAVLDWSPGHQLVVTCDALVEGRHFRRDIATPEQVGRRALAVNLSDIAAMGGEPLFALVSLVLPPDTPMPWLDGLYSGLRAEADAFAVAVVGGNVAATPGPLVVDITLIGRVATGSALRRAGARPGDRLCVTGRLGAAAAGLLTVAGAPPAGRGAPPAAVAAVREALLAPHPRLAEARALADTGAITAMLDVSDGLAADLGHLCERSRVGAMVERAALPIDAATVAVARAYGRDPAALALHGGDDYELLFAVRPSAEEAALDAVRASGGAATAIGRVTKPAGGMRLRAPDGTLAPLEPLGWDHLRDAAAGMPVDGGVAGDGGGR